MSSESTAPNIRRRRTRRALVVLLPALLALAVYLWTAPLRHERGLRNASFDELIARSKRDKDDPRVFYHLGIRLRTFGQDGPAKAAFQRAATLDGDDEEAWLAWASTAAARGSEQEAFSVLDNFTRRHPKNARAHLALALFYREEAAHGRAFDEAREAARLNPQDSAVWRLVGVEAIELRRYDDAEAALRRAIERNPRDWQSHVALGNALKSQDKDTEAVASFREAARLGPDQTPALTAWGESLLARARNASEIEEARKTLERAVEKDPSSAPAHLMLGRAYMRQARLQDARAVLERAAQISPGFPGPHFELKQLYQRLQDPIRAAKEERLHRQTLNYRLERYSLLSRIYQVKDDASTRLKLARLCAAHGDYALAAREYRRLIPRSGSSAEAAKRELAALERKRPEVAHHPINVPMPRGGAGAMLSAAQLLRDADAMRAKQRYAEAARAYLNLLSREPRSARALEGLGIALDAQGDHDDAFRVLNRALNLDPSLAEAGYTVARLYYQAGFPDEAARRMQIIVRRKPNEARFHHAVGAAYSQGAAHYADAEDAFRRAVELNPTNSNYLRDLAKAEAQNHKLKEAQAHFRKALSLAPDNPDNLIGFGLFLVESGSGAEHRAEAERLLRRSLELHARNPYALLGLGRIAISRGQSEKAVAYLEDVVSQIPGYQSAWYQLGRAQEANGNAARAKQCREMFRRIIDFRTELSVAEGLARQRMKEPLLRLKLARLYAKGGENAKAINQYQVCLALDPKNAAASKELESLSARLKAQGEMPAMKMLDGMLLASVKLN